MTTLIHTISNSLLTYHPTGSRDRSVGMATTVWTIRFSNPGKGKTFVSSPKRPDWFWGPNTLPLHGYRGSCAGIYRPWRDTGHSLPSSAKVKNERSYRSKPPAYLQGVDRNKFTLPNHPTTRVDVPSVTDKSVVK